MTPCLPVPARVCRIVFSASPESLERVASTSSASHAVMRRGHLMTSPGDSPVVRFPHTIYLPQHEIRSECGPNGAMKMVVCGRCQGFMVPCFTNSLFLEITVAMSNPSWRCVNCGEWLDETIMSNRLRTTPAASFSRKSPSPRHPRWRR